MTVRLTTHPPAQAADDEADRQLEELLAAPVAGPRASPSQRIDGVRIGTLVGFADSGATPLVIYPDQPAAAAQPARATLDLHAAHIGREAVLTFEQGDPHRPIILGCLHQADATALPGPSEHLQVDADGQRVVVSAQNQIVLRCGKASITLTREGKLILQGAYVSSHSSGVLRIKGGSVQIN
jgi:Domain of unknown function (DUF6484)